MFDQSFFWDSETRQSARARSLPITTTPDRVTTLSNYAQPAEAQQRPAAEAPVGFHQPTVSNNLTDCSVVDTLDAWQEQRERASTNDDHLLDKTVLPI